MNIKHTPYFHDDTNANEIYQLHHGSRTCLHHGSSFLEQVLVIDQGKD